MAEGGQAANGRAERSGAARRGAARAGKGERGSRRARRSPAPTGDGRRGEGAPRGRRGAAASGTRRKRHADRSHPLDPPPGGAPRPEARPRLRRKPRRVTPVETAAPPPPGRGRHRRRRRRRRVAAPPPTDRGQSPPTFVPARLGAPRRASPIANGRGAPRGGTEGGREGDGPPRLLLRPPPGGAPPRRTGFSARERASVRPSGDAPPGGMAVNDPSAGSPTETLLRLLLPLDSQVRPSSQRSARAVGRPRRGRSEGLTKPSNR